MVAQSNKLTDEDWFVLSLIFEYPYYYRMRKDLEEGVPCAFCKLDPEINPILFENEHWVLTKNAFPNKRKCEVMLLIISKEHWRFLPDITPEAWASFHDMIGWAESKFDLPGGMLFLRFGDMRHNVGTIRHFHWNLWVPDRTGAVVVPIQKDREGPYGRDADLARAAEFAQRYEAGEKPDST